MKNRYAWILLLALVTGNANARLSLRGRDNVRGQKRYNLRRLGGAGESYSAGISDDGKTMDMTRMMAMSKGDKNRTKDREAYRETMERIKRNEEKKGKKDE